MDNLFSRKTVLGLCILSLLAANTSIQPIKAEEKQDKNKNKDKACTKEIEKVELSKSVVDFIAKMGKSYEFIADNGYLTGEDIINLKKKNKLSKFIDDIVDYYRSTPDSIAKKNIEEMAILLDKYQDDFNVTLTLRFGGFEPYTQGTRYAVFSREDVFETYK